jgi:threonine/homoserine/homoserine lactone efflux protein
MNLFLIFFASLTISMAGSLQLGPVNIFVINSVLFKSKRTAFFVALGGSLPEFLYCFLAVYATRFFEQSSLFQTIFQIVFILILIGVAFVFWRKKPGNILLESKVKSAKKDFKNVLKGFSLASFNPQLLPFWMFTLVFFNSTSFLQTKSKAQVFSFILGSGIGAFVFLTILLMIVNKYKLQLFKYINNRFYFKMISFLFLFLATYQTILLVKIL